MRPIFVLLLALALGSAACMPSSSGGTAPSPSYPDVTVSPATHDFKLGETFCFTVSGGNGTYTVSVNNPPILENTNSGSVSNSTSAQACMKAVATGNYVMTIAPIGVSSKSATVTGSVR